MPTKKKSYKKPTATKIVAAVLELASAQKALSIVNGKFVASHDAHTALMHRRQECHDREIAAREVLAEIKRALAR